ncbi:hypothetical protein [Ruania halotolerans]|uniref:hypothetical protein n=1 Tax=Ruania halotolerans TaxID=2897773 RepID=UPI001E438D92|nr:hypothetical protein [Ruania halotolerans]UFU04874.1 hypothetical protein LQF10_10290 [Ruania halotolerans]
MLRRSARLVDEIAAEWADQIGGDRLAHLHEDLVHVGGRGTLRLGGLLSMHGPRSADEVKPLAIKL